MIFFAAMLKVLIRSVPAVRCFSPTAWLTASSISRNTWRIRLLHASHHSLYDVYAHAVRKLSQ